MWTPHCATSVQSRQSCLLCSAVTVVCAVATTTSSSRRCGEKGTSGAAGRSVLPERAADLPLCHAHAQTEARFKELTELGLNVQVVAIGNKGKQYFQRRPKFNVVRECPRQHSSIPARDSLLRPAGAFSISIAARTRQWASPRTQYVRGKSQATGLLTQAVC